MNKPVYSNQTSLDSQEYKFLQTRDLMYYYDTISYNLNCQMNFLLCITQNQYTTAKFKYDIQKTFHKISFPQ